MEKSLLRFSLVSAALMMTPLSAFAYIAPQDLWGKQVDTQTESMIQTARFNDFVPAPPNQREGEKVITAQQARSAELRNAAQQTQLTSIDAEPLDQYVPAEAPQKPSLFDPDAQYALRQQRMEKQKGSGPTIVIAGAGVSVDSHGNILHSGAPYITGTGPESVLALIVMVLAALSTFAFALMKSKSTHASFPHLG